MKTLSWDKIQQGDEEAFRQLYEQYADLLYGYGMKIAGDDDLVTDAIQTLFVYIFEKRETCAVPYREWGKDKVYFKVCTLAGVRML